jgi:uncharacterized phage protein (TIGR01671 family)
MCPSDAFASDGFTDIGEVEIRTDTVGQYTGLKDKNGVKIFEGDIVKGIFDRIYKVIFSQHFLDWRLKSKEQDGRFDGMQIFDWTFPEMQLEVVGNVHDNPELLEAKE